MSEPDEKPNRRDLLRGVAAGAAGLGLPAAAKGDVPPATPRWMRTLGPGVADKPYGLPSPFEAEVVRRIDPALTAARESSISF
ncbi:MAG: twin-arginine translocation signal domain-containing protein, partial [Alphaproteobacteria bacterium]|nr:twin-arginine translocation signal domain-containing protein [Alphaproteobacteria bacterium]